MTSAAIVFPVPGGPEKSAFSPFRRESLLSKSGEHGSLAAKPSSQRRLQVARSGTGTATDKYRQSYMKLGGCQCRIPNRKVSRENAFAASSRDFSSACLLYT